MGYIWGIYGAKKNNLVKSPNSQKYIKVKYLYKIGLNLEHYGLEKEHFGLEQI